MYNLPFRGQGVGTQLNLYQKKSIHYTQKINKENSVTESVKLYTSHLTLPVSPVKQKCPVCFLFVKVYENGFVEIKIRHFNFF